MLVRDTARYMSNGMTQLPSNDTVFQTVEFSSSGILKYHNNYHIYQIQALSITHYLLARSLFSTFAAL